MVRGGLGVHRHVVELHLHRLLQGQEEVVAVPHVGHVRTEGGLAVGLGDPHQLVHGDGFQVEEEVSVVLNTNS